jgi:hypothetical protein
MFIMDAVFVKVFSLMHLEYLDFNVKNAKVNTLLYDDHTWSFIGNWNTLFISHWSHCNSVFLFHYCTHAMQVTGKAYAALLEGPFANSILESDSFEDEYYRLRDSTRLGATGTTAVDDGERTLLLELLRKLDHRMVENKEKFPWKTPFSVMEDLKGCPDFE